MANKIDSNVTGLRYAIEASLGILPASPTWYKLEPNSYADFGGQITTVARRPINDSRQLSKGTTTDLDASSGFNTDLLQDGNQPALIESFMFAAARRKGEDIGPLVGGLAGVTFTPIQYTASDGSPDLVFTKTTHGLATGDGPFHFVEGVGVLPGNITENTEYWIVKLDADTFNVATSYANAVAATPTVVAYSSAGTDDATRLMHRRDSVDGTNEYVYVNDKSGFVAGSLIKITGFGTAANNGLRRVTAVADGRLTVAEDLTTEAVAPSTATVVVVGVQGAAGDLDVDASGDLPLITSTALDFTTLGLTPGEFIFIGGDTAATSFSNAENAGFARVRSIAANALTLDKTAQAFITEASVTETVRLFFGRVYRNEQAALIVRQTLQFERSLGQDANGTMSEYVLGCVANQMTINMPTSDKLTVDLTFVGTDNEQRTGAQGLKSGARPSLVAEDAFNTSSDFVRTKLALVSSTDPAPSPLFAFAQELSLVVNNGVTPNKAVSVLGAFEVTAGSFEVTGSITAYFADVTSVAAVRNNSDVTIDMVLVKQNAGIAIDVPLLSLGNGRLNVELDQPITLPLEMSAAEASKVDSGLDYTLMLVYFDYLPDAAA